MTAAEASSRQRTLADQIAEELGWEIVFRKVPPGARLKEVELANRFGASRPLIREVFQQLESQGLVEYAPWRGVRVPVLTRTQLGDMFDFLAMVFGFVVRLATERASPEQIAKIEERIAKLEDLSKTDCDVETYQKARQAVHAAIDRSIGEAHELFSRRPMIRRLRHQFVIDAVKTAEQRKDSVKRWRKLLSLMKAGDAKAAEEWAVEMVTLTKAFALDAHERITPAAGDGA